MDTSKLDSRAAKKVIDALKRSRASTRSAYEAPPEVKSEDEKTIQEKLDGQIPEHRNKLLKLITSLTIASFLLLAVVVVSQMAVRLWNPAYTGVSDNVVQILAIGVFAELVGVVAVIARLVWKDRRWPI